MISLAALVALPLLPSCPSVASYKGFFLPSFFPFPGSSPLAPFQLSSLLLLLTFGSSANTRSLAETSSQLILPRTDPYTTVCPPRIIARYHCSPAATVRFGHYCPFPGKESFFLLTLSFIFLVLIFFLFPNKSIQCLRNGGEARMLPRSCKPDRTEPVTPARAIRSHRWKEMNQTTTFSLASH